MLTDLQAEYGEWLQALPDNQQESAIAEALRAIVELDLSELQAMNHRAASAVIELRDDPDGTGHGDARGGGRAPVGDHLDRALVPG